MPPFVPSEIRFWSFVNKTDNCWEWTGYLMRGYGQFNSGARNGGKIVLAHRFSWQLHHGPIPDGLDVLHHCDNPKCIRPDHLWLGTALDNAHDMIKKYGHPAKRGRSYMPKGKDHHYYHVGPKLTRKIADHIRQSKETNAALGKKYNVHSSLISMIRTGRIWK